MATLNDTIVAYLTVNNIAFSAGDYQTGQPKDQPDQILQWNTVKLGTQPTDEQLNSDYATHQANLASAEQAKEAVKASALAKLTALGLTQAEVTALIGA
jgi:hypothetical protein